MTNLQVIATLISLQHRFQKINKLKITAHNWNENNYSALSIAVE